MSELVSDTLANSLKGHHKRYKNSIAYTTQKTPNNSKPGQEKQR